MTQLNPKFFRVEVYESSSWGFDMTQATYYDNLKEADDYARLIHKDILEASKNEDILDYVVITDEKGEAITYYTADDNEDKEGLK